MDFSLFAQLSPFMFFLLVLAIAITCVFEFVNGFHDTANAVATVIYTRSLRPWKAVILSGICNFIGVFLGGIAVAMSVIRLLPAEALVSQGSGAGLAMIFAVLVAAILWNVGTWYFGLPASSSHTLIGSMLGVGVAHSLLSGQGFSAGVNWGKAGEVGLSLLISPMVGFGLSFLFVRLSRYLIRHPELFQSPKGESTPPWWIRGILISTCSGVSLAHGANDGQKGVGLVMLILIGLAPTGFAINPDFDPARLRKTRSALMEVSALYDQRTMLASIVPSGMGQDLRGLRVIPHADLKLLASELESVRSVAEIAPEKRWTIRKMALSVDKSIQDLLKKGKVPADQALVLHRAHSALREMTDYAPLWVLGMIALSIGLGTMVGWKRIVVTIGEKIGKSHLSYVQGASAELVAMSTIGLSAMAGLPVSTTQVLSSGIAGSMVAQKSGLQSQTVRKIALAWIFTLPVSMGVAGLLYPVFRFFLV